MTPAFAVLLLGLLFSGAIGSTSGLQISSFVLVAYAPLLMWLGKLRYFAERSSRNTGIVLVAIVCATLATAIALAMMA